MSTDNPALSASANYIFLIHSAEGELYPNARALRAQVMHLAPTLNYAVACAGYAEARRLLVAALLPSVVDLCDRFDHMIVLNGEKGMKGRIRAMRNIVPRPGVSSRELRRLREDVEAFERVLSGLPEVNDVRRTQFEEDVHESAVECVRLRWEFERTGSLGEEG